MFSKLLTSFIVQSSFLTKSCFTGWTTKSSNKRLVSRSLSNTSKLSFPNKENKGKVLVLGGNGFLGWNTVKRALLNGYYVTSLSRRGYRGKDDETSSSYFDDRLGDATNTTIVGKILSEGGYVAVVHCIGVLFDSASGFGRFNRLVSGSGSMPADGSTYDEITRATAFNSIEATEKYATDNNINIPYIFTSAAEANWPNVQGGSFIEKNVAPDWLRRYLASKRVVEERLKSASSIRSIVFRPGLIFSYDKVKLWPAVVPFFLGSKIGIPFVNRPITVQSLSSAIVNAIEDESIQGEFDYQAIEELSK